METRFKYDKSLLWIFGILFLIFIGLVIWIPKSWWLAVLSGLGFILELFSYRADKENDLVIDEWGIHQEKGGNYKWHQIDHCYIEGRMSGVRYRLPYLIIVLKSGKRVTISLYNYKFNKRALLNTIDQASGKSLCYQNDKDSRYEKSIFKILIFGIIIGLIFFLVWLLCS